MRRGAKLVNFRPNENQVTWKPGLSSLPLQMCVYYNGLFSLIFAVLMGFISIEKLTKYEYITAIAAYSIWFIVEPVRIYFGFAGNLKESVPNMATFLLMTVFPQLPLVCFLAYFQPTFYPMDKILGSFMFIFLIVEFALGLLTMRTIIRSQTAQFMRLVEED